MQKHAELIQATFVKDHGYEAGVVEFTGKPVARIAFLALEARGNLVLQGLQSISLLDAPGLVTDILRVDCLEVCARFVDQGHQSLPEFAI